jgi:hypothetical protein
VPLTRYRFRHAVSAFFEMPREVAKPCLPGRLEPLEANHGIGVFAATAFDFVDSEVGAYQELVLSILTPPRISVGGEWPRSAFFPFVVGTSTEASRLHAIERWRLPHYMRDIDVEFEENTDRIRIRAHERGRPVLDLDVSGGEWGQTQQLYQVFSASDDQLYKADVHMEGLSTEHEEETGRLVLHDHPMCARLTGADVASRPFREIWQRNGVQSFEALKVLA